MSGSKIAERRSRSNLKHERLAKKRNENVVRESNYEIEDGINYIFTKDLCLVVRLCRQSRNNLLLRFSKTHVRYHACLMQVVQKIFDLVLYLPQKKFMVLHICRLFQLLVFYPFLIRLIQIFIYVFRRFFHNKRIYEGRSKA
jgi:hypothetical protein